MLNHITRGVLLLTCLLSACIEAPPPDRLELPLDLPLDLPLPAAAEAPALTALEARRALAPLPELEDPTLALLEAGCPLDGLGHDDLSPCADDANATCLGGDRVIAEVADDGHLAAVEYPGRYAVRCTADTRIESWWHDGTWMRSRTTTWRGFDAHGVRSGLTEDTTATTTQVAGFEVDRGPDGAVLETRRRLFPARGEGICQDERRRHRGDDYTLEVLPCMQGW